MEKFNLKEKRKELVQVLRTEFGIHNSKAWSIVKRVEEQDTEFIKRVEDVVANPNLSLHEKLKEIDKLSGGL